MKNYQRHVTVSKLKTAYGTLSKVLQTAEAKHGSIASWYSESDILTNPDNKSRGKIIIDFTNTYIVPYLNVTNSGIKLLEDFGYKKDILCADGSSWFSSKNMIYGILLANGMFITINTASHSSDDGKRTDLTKIVFYVDIDGPTHGANTLGRDIFTFEKYISSDLQLSKLTMFSTYASFFDPDTKKFTYTFRTRDKLFANCQDRGFACGALIMTDGWKISDDYPWL